MSNKKRVRAFSQKAIVYLVALTIILGAGILAPKITNAEEPGFDDQAIYGAAEAVLGQSFTIFARTGDTEDTAGKPQAEWTAGFKTYLYYKNHYADTWATRIEGVYAGGGFFRYTMSGGPGGLFGYATRGDVGERDTTSSCVDPDNDDCDNVCTAETRDTNECIDNSFDYYLKTIDSDGNSTCWAPSTWTSSDLSLYYPGEGPAAVEFGSCNKTENLVRVYPDVSLSSGYEAKKISGGVKVDGAAVEDAWVFIENIGRAEQTDVDGNFTLDWLVWNDNYDLNALYLDGESNPWKGEMWSIAVGTTSEINLYPTGEGNMEEGGPGSGGMGDIMYTCPDDGMMGAPMDIIAAVGQIQAPILVAFTKPMDASTINADNIFLWKVNPNKSFDFELNPAGTAGSAFEDSGIDYSVGYYDPQADPKLFNFYFGPDPMAVIYIAPGATKLSPATQYVVELPPTIKDASANPLQGARPEGGHMFMFGTSGGDFMDEGPGDDYGTGGMYMPPFVTNISPMSGSFGIPENANILINFSEPMDGTSINQDAGTTQGNVRVYKITSTAGGESSVEKPVQVELDKSSKMTAVITPTGGFITTGTGHYRIEVRGGAKNSSGITMGPPGVDQSNFQSDFEVDITKTDSTAPTVLATNLEMYTLSSGVYTDIPTNQVIEVAFTEEMNPTTITANTILVKLGTKAVSGTVKYDPGMQQARFIPSSAFNANNTTYTLTIAGGGKWGN